MRGVFLDRDTVDFGDLDLASLADSLDRLDCHDSSVREEVAARIADCEVVITNKVVLDAKLLAGATKLKLVCIAATGTNNVDLASARRLGVAVCNVRAYATPAVVQHVFLLVLALATRFTDYRQLIRDGGWQRSPGFCLAPYPIFELAGRTLGIVGYGELGQAVARTARAFDMEVLVAQRPGSADDRADRLPLAELLPRVDVLSLHCPLTDSTRGLVGAGELALMKPGALLINTARGGIVDEPALAQALRAGRLGGAGIDVLTREPPAAGNPLLADDIPNLIVTPHIAWASRESRQRLVDQLAENIRAFAAGTLRNEVTNGP
jgi:glycerate dehydrogenase